MFESIPRRFKLISSNLLRGVVLTAALVPFTAQATVLLAGNATTNISAALTSLGVTFTNVGSTLPGALNSGDTLIYSFDGGSGFFPNFTSDLNSGADIIGFGGSNGGGYASWLGQYINNTGENGWHTDGKWNELVNNTATQFLPATYTPQNNSVTYHMTHLLATVNTVMLAANDEGQNIAAFRSYSSGGSFNVTTIDPGPYGTASDLANFTVPYLRGALLAAQNGLGTNQIPEPQSLALVALGIVGMTLIRRRVNKV
jgi:hypothetical protein